MSNGIMSLPPKMAEDFAAQARAGKADRYVGAQCYEFYRGNIVITLVGIDPPIGHQKKVSAKEMEHLRSKP